MKDLSIPSFSSLPRFLLCNNVLWLDFLVILSVRMEKDVITFGLGRLWYDNCIYQTCRRESHIPLQNSILT